jgi:LacI family transcriptional regulator
MKTNRSTISDVARHAGVSIATVSRVLNSTGPVEHVTASRVRASVEALNYIPHPAARSLASNRTNTIGLLLPEISGAFFEPMLRGVETAASEAGYDLLIHTTRNPEAINAPRRPLAEHNTDGLLVFTGSLDAHELARLYTNGFPTVLLHQTPPPRIPLPVVTVENQSGAQAVVEHLITYHHCSKIAFLRGPDGHEDSSWREKGYRQALKTHGLPFDPALISRGGFNRQEARLAIETMLKDGIKVDAIFAGDDDASIGVLLGLRHAGVRVPDDIAVVGFDDQAFATTLIPPLTTVRAPTELVGNKAVHQLVHIMRGESIEPRLVLPTELVVRQSCGCQEEPRRYSLT